MIHYHGGPITPERAAYQVWKARHAFVSFAHPGQIEIAAECCQSFALDNGAFTFWKSKKEVKWSSFYEWCEVWINHPGCDWAAIPDVIEGGSKANDDLLAEWPFGHRGVPVWHMDEPISRLEALADNWPRVAIGSSGQYDVVNVPACLRRLREAVTSILDAHGHPKTKLHGMRMLNTSIFTQVPLASADSTTVARNVGLDVHWQKHDSPISKGVRGLVMVDKIEFFNSPAQMPKKLNLSGGFGL